MAENIDNTENIDDLDDNDEDFWAKIQVHYRVDVIAPDVFDRAGEGGEDDIWADNHTVSLLATDKAECRMLARRMLDLWHLEDASVTEVNICIMHLSSDFYIEESIKLPESEL